MRRVPDEPDRPVLVEHVPDRITWTEDERSTAADRESVAITVYNQNFGLVREVRSIDLARGPIALEYRDVASSIQPETVHEVGSGASTRPPHGPPGQEPP